MKQRCGIMYHLHKGVQVMFSRARYHYNNLRIRCGFSAEVAVRAGVGRLLVRSEQPNKKSFIPTPISQLFASCTRRSLMRAFVVITIVLMLAILPSYGFPAVQLSDRVADQGGRAVIYDSP